MSLLVFLSYSHKDRELAGELKLALAEFGFDVFLAHEDISPSSQWQKTILKKLRECDIFIPILTKEFPKSDWTDQETGVALSRGKLVMPLKVDLNPYGFVGARQALVLNKESATKTCWNIAKALAESKRYAKLAKDGAIQVFLHSSTFDKAKDNLEELLELGLLSRKQFNDIMRGSSRNQNIYGSFKARPLMENLISKGKGRISPRFISEYRRQVKTWG